MRLIHERGGERIAYPIEEGETYVGRKDYCDIHLPDGSLSKRHARLVREGSSLLLYDAGSRNGTLVNGTLIDGERRLENGDVIQLGKLEFVVEGIPADGSAEDFALVDDEEEAPASAIGAGGGRGASRQQARAVASNEVRPSVLDVLPEVPPSTEDAGEAPRAAARFRLVDGGEEQTWDLDGGTVTLGTKAENAIVLSGEGVSRYHAEAVHEEGAWLLKDLGARNGLFVGGNRVDIHELQDGDEVQIGTVRLRFELVQPSALSGVSELLQRIKEDPAGAVKEDQRVRLGLAAMGAAFLLLLMAMAGGGSAKATGDRALSEAWCAEGTRKLVAGEYGEAEDVFRKARSRGRATGAHRELARAMLRVAEMWARSDDPLKFRWTKAGELLDDVAGYEDLPDVTRRWVEEQTGWVERNAAAYETLADAEGFGARAAQLASTQGRFNQALRTFRKALTAYAQVSGDSLFAARAADQARAIRRRIHETIVAEIERRKDVTSPRWDQILELVSKGLEYARTSEQRAELRRFGEEAEINKRDEKRYMRAVEIVRIRDVPNYPVAVRLLQQIDRRSLIYPDAQAYIDWIDADLKVREARKAYDQADHERAFLLLNEALQYDVLGSEARASVRTRKQKWARVVRAFQRGMRASRAGQFDRAKRQLKRVISAEPEKSNRYVRQAQAQLEHIITVESWGLERKLREGFDLLDRADYTDALQRFNQAGQDPNCTARDVAKIRQAVASANRTRRLLKNAESLLIRDRSEKFLDLYYIFKLLKTWLPPDHPDKEKATRYYEQVQSRLNMIMKGADGDRRR